MQAENKKNNINNIKTLSFGCRLNALESEKIQRMLAPHISAAIVVNTCAVTAEAERQSGQAVRRIARENPNAPIFVTGCAVTRNPELFSQIPNTVCVHNREKRNLDAYAMGINQATCNNTVPTIENFNQGDTKLSKQFVQIQNGCNHNCAYCITRALRGPSVSFEYADILADVQAGIANGFNEIVLTGVDIASYVKKSGDKVMLLSDLCRTLLNDVPGIKRLRLSSVDPAVPDIAQIIDMIKSEPRMMPHMHFSMQSGSDTILKSMGRRHNAQMVRDLVARGNGEITFSWDIICGFPGETEELFQETLDLVRETKPIKIHAFPFSPRPGTPAADMQHQVNRAVSKERVRIINDAANANRAEFMRTQLGKTVQVLVEENNIARCPHDIAVKIDGTPVKARTISKIKLIDIIDDYFVGKVVYN
ncbi:MAG: MiaB/RimO family radical SAM methylthiotransferase [Alphaproteobacteria bacterium]|nr:MiaB/RimO family radical SAM methylthiotransferase [Alphaproteobacteria bacterium]